jgi:hypothetical protein
MVASEMEIDCSRRLRSQGSAGQVELLVLTECAQMLQRNVTVHPSPLIV